MNDPRSFGAVLRRERECRGVTVEAIAEQTKLGVGLLEGLERGDLSRWPGGIFRRAFVRSYAEVIGLDAASVVETFTRLCPEQGASVPADRVISAHFGVLPRQVLRLTLAEEQADAFPLFSRRRLRAAAVDLGAVALPAVVCAVVSGAAAGWVALGLAAVLYHLAGVLLVGSTPGTWLMSRAALRGPIGAPALPAAPAEDQSDMGEHTEEPASETDEMRRPTAEVFFTPRRRERRQVARPERYPRRSSDPRAFRR